MGSNARENLSFDFVVFSSLRFIGSRAEIIFSEDTEKTGKYIFHCVIPSDGWEARMEEGER